jgi:hypothetical protein
MKLFRTKSFINDGKDGVLCLGQTFSLSQRERVGVRESRSDENSVLVRKKNKHSEDGFVATMTFIILLALILILVTGVDGALFHLHREVKVLEQQQIKRLSASQTNSVAFARSDSTHADSK